MELVAYHEADAIAEWKLADVRQNRSGLSAGCLEVQGAELHIFVLDTPSHTTLLNTFVCCYRQGCKQVV